MTGNTYLISTAPWVVFLCLASLSRGQDDAVYRRLDAYVTEQIERCKIPGAALAVVKGNKVVFLEGYGTADNEGTSVTPQTSFIIGSLTKSFTALAIMQLVEA